MKKKIFKAKVLAIGFDKLITKINGIYQKYEILKQRLRENICMHIIYTHTHACTQRERESGNILVKVIRRKMP